mgnify:CR=1 FL=1
MADEVPIMIIELACGETDATRSNAAENLYCLAANQGVGGEVSPHLAAVLVRLLKEDLCRDRELAYYVLLSIFACLAWNVNDESAGKRLLIESRKNISAGLDTYLFDLRRLNPNQHPSLLQLLVEMAARHHPVVLETWRDVVVDAALSSKRVLFDAYQEALEHVGQHTEDPDECPCGEGFWIKEDVERFALDPRRYRPGPRL